MTDVRNSRTVTVSPERLPGFLARFADRHGRLDTEAGVDRLMIMATDGAAAVITVPFPPISWADGDPIDQLLNHAQRPRVLGAILVRKGGYAVGVFSGRDLVASKVGSLYVQGRTKAGGWSQQRYARRRAQQARQAYEAVSEVAVAILLPRLAELEAVVTGGDRAGVSAVLDDPRLSELSPLVPPRTLPVPDPRLRVLRDFPDRFLAVEIGLNALA